jgi:gamma-glutamyltranspeptidase / glutathione hydrolase
MPRPARRMPVARSMITAPQPEAVEAGADILRAGGSAVDAMLACAFTQGVVDPLMCGIGGLGTLQVYDPATGRHQVIDGMGTCPGAATAELWARDFLGECPDGFGFIVKGNVNEIGRRAVTTPGIVAAFALAHQQFGKLPWADLFAPAIRVAREGWPVRPHVAGVFATNDAPYGRLPYVDKLRLTPDGIRLYLRPDGSVKKMGDIVTNPDLADTLAVLARDGAAAFYTGEIAARIVADQAKHGGLLSAADLAGFAPRVNSPITVAYRGRKVAVPAPPAGGITVAQILRILERFDVAALGHNSPEYIRVVAEAMKIAGRDKDENIGDPDFFTPPLARMLSDEWADAQAGRIKRGEKASLARVLADAPHTTTLSAVDADGMVVSVTHTLATPSGVIPEGTGFMMNGAMNWYDPRPGRPSSIAPGKRRFSTLAPTIVFEDDKPVMTIGAPGGAWIGIAILQGIVNVLDFGMTMQEAAMAPRFSATSDKIDISNRIPRATQRALEAMGYEVVRSPLTFAFAGVHGITMWDGVLEGGADPQRDGYPAAVV